MSSLYKIIKKSAPYCKQHMGNQALFYNVQQVEFLCQDCITCGNAFGQNGNFNQAQKKIFKLQDIVENPVLLMLKQGSFLSKIDPSPSQTSYKVQEFIKILADMDTFIKNKKSTHQFTQSFLTHIKQQINNKIDSILQRLHLNVFLIEEMQQKTRKLKNIKKDYSNQFIETLESSFINGTEEELRELLKRYSIENENPFRKIDQIVGQITCKIDNFEEVNWQHLQEIQRKLSDPYMWRMDKVFLLDKRQFQLEENSKNNNLSSLKEENIILPYSAPFKLEFKNMTGESESGHRDRNKYSTFKSNTEERDFGDKQEQGQRQSNTKDALYVRCTNEFIELLTLSENDENLTVLGNDDNRSTEDSHQVEMTPIDRYEIKEDGLGIDMLYELPYRMLVSVCYQGLMFFSYQFNKIKLIGKIDSIKGTSEILIFGDYIIVIAFNNLYQINYSQLSQIIRLGFQAKKQDESIESVEYLYEDRRKVQHSMLINLNSNLTGSRRQIKINLSNS